MISFINTLIPDISNAARFQAIATWVENLLVATGGWVVTADTGQTLPGSLAIPGSNNQQMGYRIYRMNDALQATAPCFVKLAFGSGAAPAVWSIWVTVGTGSNGSGTITGIVVNNFQLALGTNNLGYVNNTYGSADVNRFVYALFVQGTNTTQAIQLLSLERSKDSNGNDTSDGFIFISGQATVSPFGINICFYGPWSGTIPATEGQLSFVLSSNNPAASYGAGDVGIGVIIPFKGMSQQPGMNVVAANSNDVSAEGMFQMVLYGQVRTYVQTRMQFIRAGSTALDANARACIRYD